MYFSGLVLALDSFAAYGISNDHSYVLPLFSPAVLTIPSSFLPSLTNLSCFNPHMALKTFSKV